MANGCINASEPRVRCRSRLQWLRICAGGFVGQRCPPIHWEIRSARESMDWGILSLFFEWNGNCLSKNRFYLKIFRWNSFFRFPNIGAILDSAMVIGSIWLADVNDSLTIWMVSRRSMLSLARWSNWKTVSVHPPIVFWSNNKAARGARVFRRLVGREICIY